MQTPEHMHKLGRHPYKQLLDRPPRKTLAQSLSKQMTCSQMLQKKKQRQHRSMEIIDDLDASQSGQSHGLQGKSRSMYTLDMSDDEDEDEAEDEDEEGDPEAGGDEKGRRGSKEKAAVGREGVSMAELASVP